MLDTISRLGSVMAPNENTFYERLGRRVGERRRALGITQVQLAGTLGIAQQTMAHYEAGKVRFAAALLPVLATTLQMSIEELIGIEARARQVASGKRGPTPKIQQQLERVNQLPRSKQQFVMRVLDSVLAQAGN